MVDKKVTDLDSLANELAKGHKTQAALFGESGVFTELQRKTIEAILK